MNIKLSNNIDEYLSVFKRYSTQIRAYDSVYKLEDNSIVYTNGNFLFVGSKPRQTSNIIGIFSTKNNLPVEITYPNYNPILYGNDDCYRIDIDNTIDIIKYIKETSKKERIAIKLGTTKIRKIKDIDSNSWVSLDYLKLTDNLIIGERQTFLKDSVLKITNGYDTIYIQTIYFNKENHGN